MKPTHVVVLALVVGAVLAGAAGALDDEPEDAPLLPIPGLLRPKERPSDRPAAKNACTDPAPTRRADALPFAPGENLQFDVHVLGLRTGRILLRMSGPTRVDDVEVLPVTAYAKTDTAFSLFGDLEGRMLSYLDPKDALPVRMVNHVQTKQMWKDPAISREDAAFSDDGQVSSRVTYWRDGKERSWPGKSAASSDLADVLSVVYYARTRELTVGAPFCFQVYHRRRIWQVEGKVAARERVSAPNGKRDALRVDVVARKLGGKKSSGATHTLTVHLSDDAERLPLLVRTRDGLTDIAVALSAHVKGRALPR